MTTEESFLILPLRILSIKNAVVRSENPDLRIKYADLDDGGTDEQSILDYG